MSFAEIKKNILWKMENLDKSNKKSIDEKIKRLCNLINDKPNYVTTSSCSGRITLTRYDNKKTPNAWIFKSHEKIKANDLKNIHLPNDLYMMKMESAILHIACKTTDDAIKILNLAREAGFKRSGIISIKPEKVMVEILSTESLSLPFSINKNRLVSDEYLEFCVKIANEKLDRTHEKIKKLEKLVEEKLSSN